MRLRKFTELRNRPRSGRISAFRMNSSSWCPSTRLAFRFAFSYFGLYTVASHLLVYLFVPPNTLPGQGLGTLWALSGITSWTAVHVFGITEPLVYTGNSRDTNFFWVQLFVVLVTAVAVTIVWTLTPAAVPAAWDTTSSG